MGYGEKGFYETPKQYANRIVKIIGCESIKELLDISKAMNYEYASSVVNHMLTRLKTEKVEDKYIKMIARIMFGVDTSIEDKPMRFSFFTKDPETENDIKYGVRMLPRDWDSFERHMTRGDNEVVLRENI